MAGDGGISNFETGTTGIYCITGTGNTVFTEITRFQYLHTENIIHWETTPPPPTV